MRLCGAIAAMMAMPPEAHKTSEETHRVRLLRFGGAGVLSAATDFAVFGAALASGIPATQANIAAFLVANVQSYLLNARLTFRSGGKGAPLSFGGYGKFLLAHAFSLGLSTAIIALAAPILGPWPAKFIALGVAAVWNYSASAFFVFSGNKTGTY